MRTKEEILKQDKHDVEIGVRERLNFGSRDLLFLEVLIDIRDILNEALLYYKGLASPWPKPKGGERNDKD